MRGQSILIVYVYIMLGTFVLPKEKKRMAGYALCQLTISPNITFLSAALGLFFRPFFCNARRREYHPLFVDVMKKKSSFFILHLHFSFAQCPDFLSSTDQKKNNGYFIQLWDTTSRLSLYGLFCHCRVSYLYILAFGRPFGLLG